MFINKNLFISVLMLMSVALEGCAPAGKAGITATQSSAVSGAFITTSTTVHSSMEDKFNTIIELSSATTYTGTLEGTSTLSGTLVLHRDESGDFKGIETFTGSVDGKPGTLTFQVTGSSDLYQATQLTNSVTGGTGSLANLQGGLLKVGIIKDNGPEGTYTGQISQAGDPL